MAPPQLTKIGKYEGLEVIGRGGMGVVYRAVDPGIGRQVAIKMVTAAAGDDPDLLKRFYREAKSTGILQHPNIVTVHELGDQQGVPYLVMEFVEGQGLESVIRSRSDMAIAEKLSLLVQVCDGLNYAHRRNIVHRDIKPANILVNTEGCVKIVDFGIARFGNEHFTRTGQVMGSINYMSPEQINGEDADSRTDIYSTGVVLFELLTGQLPFRGKDTTSTLMKILHDPVPSLSLFLRSYPAELEQVLARALAKKRQDRYASIEDLGFDVQRIQEDSRDQLIAGYLSNAQVCLEQSDLTRAKENLRQVLKLDRQNTRANQLVREIQAHLQKQQRNEQLLQLNARADEALRHREWDEALAFLDQAIEIDPSDPQLIERRDAVCHSQALLNEALGRAESANQAGDLDLAKKAIEEALAVDPGDSRARALKAIVSKELAERSKRRAIEVLVGEAQKEVSARRFTEALEVLRRAEQLDPGAPEVQQLLGFVMTAREQENRKRALEQFSQEIEDLLNRDEYGAACARADEALLQFKEDPGLLRLRAFAEKQREAWKKRVYVESQIDVAHSLLDEGNNSRAAAVLHQALGEYPGESSLLSVLAIVNEAMKRAGNERAQSEQRDLQIGEAGKAEAAFREEVGGNEETSLEIDKLQTPLQAIDVEQTRLFTITAPAVESGAATRLFSRGAEVSKQEQGIQIERSASNSSVRQPVKPLVPARAWIALAGVALLAGVVGLIQKFSRPSNPLLIVATTPQGATVIVGNRACNSTDCRLRLKPGSYELRAMLPGYRDVSQMVTVDAKRGELTVSMTLEPVATAASVPELAPPPAPETPAVAETTSEGTLVVQTGLPQVEILIDGKKRGRADGQGVFRLSLQPRNYSVLAQKAGFISALERNVPVSKGRDITVHLNLPPAPQSGVIALAGASAGAQVVANGQTLGTVAADGSFSKTLDAGDYALSLSKDGQKTGVVKKHIRPGEILKLGGSELNFPATLVKHAAPPQPNVPPVAAPSGAASARATTVTPPPAATLLVSAKSIHQGESVVLSWETRNTTEVLIDGIGTLPSNGTKTVMPSTSTTYRLTAKGPGGTTVGSFPPILVSAPLASASSPSSAGISNPGPSLFGRDRDGIKQALERWKSAYESESLDDMKRAWPGISKDQQKKLKETFSTFTAIKVALNYQDNDIRIAGDSAEVICQQVMRYTLNGRVQPDQPNTVSVRLSRKGEGAWAVASVSGR
jgi:serine/threonine protein kinase